MWFFETIRRHYPQLVGKYAGLYASSAYAPREYRDSVRRYVDELLERYGLRDMDEEEEAPRPGERAAGAAASGRSSGKPLEIAWEPPAGSPGSACGGCPAANAGAAAGAGAVASAGAAADGGFTGAAGDSASRRGFAGGSRTARQSAGTPGAAQAVAAAAGTAAAKAGTPLALEPDSAPAQLVFTF
ncbi:hypothetical protein ACWGPW_19950 [Paenibacillus chitinolyticus]